MSSTTLKKILWLLSSGCIRSISFWRFINISFSTSLSGLILPFVHYFFCHHFEWDVMRSFFSVLESFRQSKFFVLIYCFNWKSHHVHCRCPLHNGNTNSHQHMSQTAHHFSGFLGLLLLSLSPSFWCLNMLGDDVDESLWLFMKLANRMLNFLCPIKVSNITLKALPTSFLTHSNGKKLNLCFDSKQNKSFLP